MATTTTGNIMTSGNLAEYIRSQAIPTFKSNLMFAKMGRLEELPKGFNKYSFPTVDAIADAVALTEGITPSDSDFRLTNVEVTLSQFGRHLTITDLLSSDSPVDAFLTAATEVAYRTAKGFDSDIQNVIDAGTNVTYVGQSDRASITASDTITANSIATEVNKLKASDAPTFEGGYYAAIMHPHVFHDLQQESGTGTHIDLYKYDNPEALLAGESGALYGARILVTSSVQFYADGGASNVDVYPTYVFGNEAYGVVMSGGLQTIIEGLGSAGTADPLHQRATIAGKVRGKAAILKQDALRRIESASSLGANS